MREIVECLKRVNIAEARRTHTETKTKNKKSIWIFFIWIVELDSLSAIIIFGMFRLNDFCIETAKVSNRVE